MQLRILTNNSDKIRPGKACWWPTWMDARTILEIPTRLHSSLQCSCCSNQTLHLGVLSSPLARHNLSPHRICDGICLDWAWYFKHCSCTSSIYSTVFALGSQWAGSSSEYSSFQLYGNPLQLSLSFIGRCDRNYILTCGRFYWWTNYFYGLHHLRVANPDATTLTLATLTKTWSLFRVRHGRFGCVR